MSGLHVGYVLKVYPRLSETFVVNEILGLEARGVAVTIFALRVPTEGRFHEKLARVRADVVYLPDRTAADLLGLIAGHRDTLSPVRERLGELLWQELDGEPSIRSLGKGLDLALEARRRGVDHLHAHFATSATEVARMASLCSGIPYSFTAHAKDIYHDSADPDTLRRRLADASFAVTVCDSNREHLERLRVGSTPIRRIYNGLDLDEYRPRPRPATGATNGLRILGVGRLIPKKGFDVLLEAARLLEERGLAFGCTIIGDGAQRGELAARCHELGLGHRVRFAGALPVEQVREAMVEADVVVLPARIDAEGNRDALPTVLLEAMALERPFVSTPVVGIPEIAGEAEAGILVPPDDATALADALARLAAHPTERDAIGRAGRRRALRLFDVRHSTAELHRLFDRSAGVPAAVAQGAPCVSST